MKLEINVQGQVQGVGFRYFTKQKADSLGLTGWVKNLPDGSVSVQVKGKDERLDKFISWLKKGPPLARVDKLDQKEIGISDFEYDEFRVLRT